MHFYFRLLFKFIVIILNSNPVLQKLIFHMSSVFSENVNGNTFKQNTLSEIVYVMFM